MEERRVACYIRVSTQEQAAHGFSVGEQETRLRKYCEAHEWTIAGVYEDPGFSGAYLDRPGIQKLIRDVDLGIFDTVLVWKLDRLSRSQKNTMYMIEDVFLKHDINFISMNENFDTSTPFGRAMVGILSVFAQLDRDQITQRMTMGRIGRAKAGYYSGGSQPPIGYTYTRADGSEKKTLEVDEYEAMQVRMVFDLFLNGLDGKDMTFTEIAKYMAAHYTNRYGGWKQRSTISRMLTNPVYIGKVKFSGDFYDGMHEPIISEDTFDKAQVKYQRYIQNFSQSIQNFNGSYLLTGLIHCGVCGGRYFVTSVKNTHATAAIKPYYHSYTCYGRKPVKKGMAKNGKCSNTIYKMEVLDDYVLKEIQKLKETSELIGDLRTGPKDDKTAAIDSRIRELDKQMGKLVDLYQLGTIAFDEIRRRTDAIRAERDKLKGELEHEKRPDGVISETEFGDRLDAFDADIFSALDIGHKQAIVRSLINKIVIYPDSIEIRWAFH